MIHASVCYDGNILTSRASNTMNSVLRRSLLFLFASLYFLGCDSYNPQMANEFINRESAHTFTSQTSTVMCLRAYVWTAQKERVGSRTGKITKSRGATTRRPLGNRWRVHVCVCVWATKHLFYWKASQLCFRYVMCWIYRQCENIAFVCVCVCVSCVTYHTCEFGMDGIGVVYIVSTAVVAITISNEREKKKIRHTHVPKPQPFGYTCTENWELRTKTTTSEAATTKRAHTKTAELKQIVYERERERRKKICINTNLPSYIVLIKKNRISHQFRSLYFQRRTLRV